MPRFGRDTIMPTTLHLSTLSPPKASSRHTQTQKRADWSSYGPRGRPRWGSRNCDRVGHHLIFFSSNKTDFKSNLIGLPHLVDLAAIPVRTIAGVFPVGFHRKRSSISDHESYCNHLVLFASFSRRASITKITASSVLVPPGLGFHCFFKIAFAFLLLASKQAGINPWSAIVAIASVAINLNFALK